MFLYQGRQFSRHFLEAEFFAPENSRSHGFTDFRKQFPGLHVQIVHFDALGLACAWDRRIIAFITLPEGRGSFGLPVLVIIAVRVATRSGAMEATC